MKQKKLFENVSGNQFKLITESIEESNPKSKLVKEGLKKLFSNGHKEISYQVLQGVGLGYIRDVSEAKKCAIQEARQLASEYGYMDNENSQKFVKEVNPETDAANPEEKREVQIGNEILSLLAAARVNQNGMESDLIKIERLARELIQMHGTK